MLSRLDSENLHVLFLYVPQGFFLGMKIRWGQKFSDFVVRSQVPQSYSRVKAQVQAQLLHRAGEKPPNLTLGQNVLPWAPDEGSRARPLSLLPPAAPPPTPDAPLPTSFQGRVGAGLCHLGWQMVKG